jgi:hypothetical protein
MGKLLVAVARVLLQRYARYTLASATGAYCALIR